MYAIIRTGGKQFRAEKGAVLRVPLMEASAGDSIEISDVLQVTSEEKSTLGKPLIPKAKVSATVLRHGKEPKILVYTYKRRKGYEKRKGHRQDFTEIRINDIQVGA
ncbi:MAG: 50S ribosomal protein L21 [Candidatus Sumerlaeaceae bacterium]|nr:50S ribosomal protein L21 [Candidatus Sumerlaeaceae bacterium]